MVWPLVIRGALFIGGLYVAGSAAKKVGQAADDSDEAIGNAATLAKWATIGGGLYVSYQALKATGALK